MVHILKLAKFHYKFGGDDEQITIADLRSTKISLHDNVSFTDRATNGFKFMTMTLNLLMNFKISRTNPIASERVNEMCHAS